MVDFARLLDERRERRLVEAGLLMARQHLVDVLQAAIDRPGIAHERPRIEIVEPVESKPPARPRVDLSLDQEEAVARVVELLGSSRRVVTLAGAAGTGKTTCVRAIIDRLDCPYVLAAPTGKAALRLRQLTGEPAVTLHRIAYQGAFEHADGALEFNQRAKGSVRGADLFNFGDGGDGRSMAAVLRGGGRAVVIADEASMVGAKLLDDLVGLNGALGDRVKLLAVGDHCQLPPVKADAAFDLERADAVLDKVHRQAEGGALLDLVTYLRTERTSLTAKIATRFGFPPEFMSAQELAQRAAVEIDFTGSEWVGLVSTNRQRLAVNRLARRGIGFPPMSDGPQVGELVIALDNSYSIPCANGEIGTVVAVGRWEVDGIEGYSVDVDFGDRVAQLAVPAESWSDEGDKTAGKISRAQRDAIKAVVWRGGREGLEADRVASKLVGLAPAYSLTVHKSQGSEWARGAFVLGKASWLGEDEWRLAYTAATRFRESVTFVVGCAS